MFVRKRKENDSEKLHSAILERKNDGNFGKSVCGFFSGWRFCGMLGLLLQRLCGDVLWLAALTMTLAMASPILILIWKILLFKEERTASCKLYPRSFCDFSSGIGGDIIRFASAVLGLNNWEACRYLIEAFSLPFSLSGHTDNREQIRRREQERQRQQEKERRFKAAWVAEVERLKTWENVYQRAITEKVFPPLSDLQTFTVGELQKVSYELDVLCIYGSRREQEAILISEGWEL